MPHPLESLQLKLRPLDFRTQMLHIKLHHFVPGAFARVLHSHRHLNCSLARHLRRAHLDTLVSKARIAEPVTKGIKRLVFAVEIRPSMQQVVVQSGSSCASPVGQVCVSRPAGE